MNIIRPAAILILSLSFLHGADTIGGPHIIIDGKDIGRTYDGIGALSAGASSRLLIDYPEPQRSEILDKGAVAPCFTGFATSRWETAEFRDFEVMPASPSL